MLQWWLRLFFLMGFSWLGGHFDYDASRYKPFGIRYWIFTLFFVAMCLLAFFFTGFFLIGLITSGLSQKWDFFGISIILELLGLLLVWRLVIFYRILKRRTAFYRALRDK